MKLAVSRASKLALLAATLAGLGLTACPKTSANVSMAEEPGAANSAVAPEQEGSKVDAPPSAESGAIECNRPEQFGPVIVTESQYLERHGARATKFSELATSKEQPAEVCGIEAQVNYLLDLRCDDGTNPYANFDAAHGSRVGNVGPGGRCDSIIDLYAVPCPEGNYEVFIDAYICPPG
jgi:hypothetical protein